MKHRCPQCGKPTDRSAANPWRPFCSERCKLIDFGAWVDGSRAIPGDEVVNTPDENNPPAANDDRNWDGKSP